MDVRNEERVVLRVRCQSLLVCTSHEGRRCGRDGCAGRCGGAIGGGLPCERAEERSEAVIVQGKGGAACGGRVQGLAGLESWTPEQLGRLQLGRRCERGLSGRLLSMGREGYGREEEEGAVTD
jgi:hypothetical protein